MGTLGRHHLTLILATLLIAGCDDTEVATTAATNIVTADVNAAITRAESASAELERLLEDWPQESTLSVELDTRIDAATANQIQDALGPILARLQALETELQLEQDPTRFELVEGRVTQNEVGVQTNGDDIATNASDIAANTADIGNNASDIAANTADIGNNASDIAANTADIGNNASDIAANTADIADNSTSISALETLALCPAGYEDITGTDPTFAGDVLCGRIGVPTDEVVRVGDFWIDRYEAGVYPTSTCTGSPIQDVSALTSFDPVGQSGVPFTCSRAGVLPSAEITWFQAQAVCSAMGKRLPTNAEWQRAMGGTPETSCMINESSPAAAGTEPACTSDWGVVDGIGNLEEWVADWSLSQDKGNAGGYDNPSSPWDSDARYYVESASTYSTGAGVSGGLPPAPTRGGAYNFGNTAGITALNLRRAPSSFGFAVGFRCAVGG